jgi:hypothetical protein
VSRPELVSLSLADPPERWRALGFGVLDGRMRVGDVEVELGAPGDGIVGWRLRGVEPGSELDGLPWSASASASASAAKSDAAHPNGAVGIDHVVVLTPDFDRTAAALDAAGLGLRRVRDAGGFRQGFRRLGPAILELVEAQHGDPATPARFWGLVVIVDDLDALADRLGDQLGPVKDAVQPGRRIATLRGSAGIATNVAFMDPE